jgi:hypothetical protein
VDGGDRDFFVAVQEYYERHMPGTPPGLRLPDATAVPHHDFGVQASGLLAAPSFRRYCEVIAYSTRAYRDVLQTYSGHIALAPAAREALLDCVATLIDREYGGHVRKQYLFEVMVARRR